MVLSRTTRHTCLQRRIAGMTSLRVGAALSLSGTYALQGRQALQGLRLWIEDTNARGGLFVSDLGRPVRFQLLTYDDRSQWIELERCLDHLTSSHPVDLLIGPYSSGLTLRAAAVAEARQTILWNHGGSSDAIMRQGFKWLVNLPTPASRYFGGLFGRLRPYLSEGAPVALVQRRRGTFAHQVISGARQQAEMCGLHPLPDYCYPEEEDSLHALVSPIAAAQPAAIVAAGRYADDVALVRALAEVRPTIQALAVVAAPMQAFWEDLGMAAEGCIGPSQWERGRGGVPEIGPTSAAFGEHFRQRFGEAPDYPAAQAYAIGLIIERCIAVAGTCNQGALLQAALGLDCHTLYGRFRLDPENGMQVGHETVLVQWQDGVKRLISPEDAAEAEPMMPKPWAGSSRATTR